jgi:hypothetical protein
MKNFMHTTSALHAASGVAPTSTCADHTAIAMWSKRLPVAAGLVKVNRNKGAAGDPGFWDPV